MTREFYISVSQAGDFVELLDADLAGHRYVRPIPPQ